MAQNFSTMTPNTSEGPQSALQQWFERVPKVELHLHLEGAIPLPALWELMKKYGGDPEVRSIEDLKRRFEYRDFTHFIQTWIWKNRFLREYEDFEFIGEAIAHELKKQNIIYAEAFYAPPNHTRKGRLQTGRITEAFRRGLSRVQGIEVNLIADLVRDLGALAAERTLMEVHEVRGFGVIGIGIGGTENEYPPYLFKNVYEKARNLGFRTTAHAGEIADADSIWGAIRELRVERIGHGTRAINDASLIEYLRQRRIPIEMCPISNVRTRSVPSIKDHPIRRFYDAGLVVFVNTDDPAMFNTSMAQEFRVLHEVHGFTPDEIRKLIINAAESSWLPDNYKRLLLQKLITHPDWRSEAN